MRHTDIGLYRSSAPAWRPCQRWAHWRGDGRRDRRFAKGSRPAPAKNQVLIVVDAPFDKGLNRNILRPFALDIFARVARSLIKVRQAVGALASEMVKAPRNEPFLFLI